MTLHDAPDFDLTLRLNLDDDGVRLRTLFAYW